MYGAVLPIILYWFVIIQNSEKKFFPKQLKSVNEETLEAYVSSYQQLIADNNQLVQQLSALDLEPILNDPLVDDYFGNLLREIQMK